MNAIASHTVAPHLLAELALHLRNTGSNLSVTQAASAAIRAWIAANTPRRRRPRPIPRSVKVTGGKPCFCPAVPSCA